jgi:hypothetical protein
MTHETCGFAWPGTYGHECGDPATVAGLMKSKLTHSEVYYARRCAKCATIKGGENAGVYEWQPLDSSKHINDWNGRYN